MPSALDEHLQHVKGLDPRAAEERNIRNVEESREWTVGPMPVPDFMRTFLGVGAPPRTLMPSSKNAFKSVPSKAASAAEIYSPLIAALNKKVKGKSRCPGFVFNNASANSPHPHSLGHMLPHICVYREENLETVKNGEPGSRTELGYAELFIEVIAGDPAYDFFTDPKSTATDGKPHSHDLASKFWDDQSALFANRSLGQHISYAIEILARQPRLCLYSVAIAGSRARLFRWDRAGCIVTESFDLRAQPDLLCEFVWRYSQAREDQRGHDTTVQPASHEEESLFLKCIRAHIRSQLQVEGAELDRAVTEHYEPNHVAVIHVLEQNAIAKADTIHRFLVSRPVISPMVLTGKGTKGFWAVDVSTHRVAFLKDTWRSRGEEGFILASMIEKGVRNVPSVLCHGDVPDEFPVQGERKVERSEIQVTVTEEFSDSSWTCKVKGKAYQFSKSVHYRVVLRDVGYSLRHSRGTEELLTATLDVLRAMSDARYKASRLHRDISLGNIILVAEPDRSVRRGYLIDWDASCGVDESGAALRRGRAGTWEFLPFRMIGSQSRERKQTLQDDMESLFYVVLYCAFLWLPHKLTPQQLGDSFSRLFGYVAPDDEDFLGGAGKVDNVIYRRHTENAGFGPSMQYWVNTMADLLDPQGLREGHTFDYPFEEDVELGAQKLPDDELPLLRASKMWTVKNVEGFWSHLLQTRTLEASDRTVHEHPRSTSIYYEGMPAILNHPSYGCGVRKRRREDDDDDSSSSRSLTPPPARRRRLGSPSPPPPPSCLRRSRRIRKQHERNQAKAS
ncbi:hypothetical protein OH76DRAFT_1488523 [Lentinus brumalis]|uniref:Fungal-type protein kinase domain-containing protein n=1 Tax=Lentinus brumalis TaxID=2498619 RepID=A0A371CQS6_9APHY|nr:hypothetical protein OH76DRAFT_1488523 [Polyporus brumalis]